MANALRPRTTDDAITAINRDMRALRLEMSDGMPDAGILAIDQVSAAVERIHEDTTGYPQFPWRALADLSGPMCPEDLIIVAARTGAGKSLFLQNVFDALIIAGRYGLYIGLEQSPEILRAKWACLRCDVAPRLLLATRADERGTVRWQTAMESVQRDLEWQRTPDVRARAHFASTRKINAAGLRAWTTWGIDHGCEFIIVDHVDRIQHGPGQNSFHEVSETVRLAKELAVDHRITMLVASQVGRPADAVDALTPPSLHALRGAGTKEEEADTVLGIYRPLKAGTSNKDIQLVRKDLLPRDRVIEPNVMGAMLLKHRLDGAVAGRSVKLAVRHQRVLEIEERDRWSTEGGYARELI